MGDTKSNIGITFSKETANGIRKDKFFAILLHLKNWLKKTLSNLKITHI